jgi:hypothetical protein
MIAWIYERIYPQAERSFALAVGTDSTDPEACLNRTAHNIGTRKGTIAPFLVQELR